MKVGTTLSDLALELERQQKTKRDFIAPSQELSITSAGDALEMEIKGHGNFGISDIAHGQLAQRLEIPAKYYDRMRREDPGLLKINANTWLHKEKENRMVRTLDGAMRAFLSSRYRPLDNYDMASAVLPILGQNATTVESCQLTEKRLYIKAVTTKIQMEVRKGDVVQAGIVISNSEVGMGSVKVEPMIYRLVCTNGMIAADSSLRKYHIAKNVEVDIAEEMYRDETRRVDDQAFWMKVKDVVRGSFRRDIFEKIVGRMKLATENPIEGNPVKVVEVVTKKFGLQDNEGGSILSHLIKGGDLTQYGLMNAITRTAEDIPDYDRATDFERMGGQVLELAKSDWREIALAA